jgi:3-methyladenine DNA glycosylase AlkD
MFIAVKGVPRRMSVEERVDKILRELRARSDPASVEGMSRFGISTQGTLGGSSLPFLRAMAKRERSNHELASALWSTGIHEARLLAVMVDDINLVTDAQAESWVKDIDSWDICDGFCSFLSYSPLAWKKVYDWAEREETYVKRSSFSLIAALSVHDKKAPDSKFIELLPLIENASTDDRNYVKKAVNWALRQIGKRNLALHSEALACSVRIQANGTKAGRWIAADAIRELRNEDTIRRLQEREDKMRRKER